MNGFKTNSSSFYPLTIEPTFMQHRFVSAFNYVSYTLLCVHPQSKYLNNFSHFLIETFSSEYFLSGDEDIMKIFPGPHLSVYLRYNGLSNLFFVTLGQATCLTTCWGSNEVIFSPGSHEHFLQRCSRLNIFSSQTSRQTIKHLQLCSKIQKS